jgi:NAD(P)-dependent dehydrogenase (short-subunit alcohol dehydrogenase family)
MTDSRNRPAALVTGAATRLGLAFAKALAAQGYNIALHYNHSAQQAEAAAAEIRALGVNCETFSCDLASGDIPTLMEDVVDSFPALALLVNSASAYTAATIAETTADLLQQQFAVNCFAPILLSRAFYERVGQGNIINIIDNKIAFQQNNYAAYLLSKKALAEFTALAAVEFAPDIRVNGIAPGVVLPGETRTADYVQWRVQGIPLHRQGEASHLVQAMFYLLNNEFVTGQVLFVDGGEGLNQRGLNAEDYPTGEDL